MLVAIEEMVYDDLIRQTTGSKCFLPRIVSPFQAFGKRLRLSLNIHTTE